MSTGRHQQIKIESRRVKVVHSEGEMRVMNQYAFQAWSSRGPECYRDMLLHTGTEEIGHIEMLATAVAMNLERSADQRQGGGCDQSDGRGEDGRSGSPSPLVRGARGHGLGQQRGSLQRLVGDRFGNIARARAAKNRPPSHLLFVSNPARPGDHALID
jgi:hypothetical protein